jgi:D-glycero-D-manno-heptose 1,7-bisphosphate phosphatase
VKKRAWHTIYKREQRYVLLKRDGVLNQCDPSGYVPSWEKFEFLPRALSGLRLLTENGFAALVISNQPCVGKGQLSSRELDAITRRFLIEAALSGGNIAQVYYCTHREEERCSCRIPQPGLLVRARIEHRFLPAATYYIGDSSDDMAAAEAAGCPGILVRADTVPQTGTPADQPPLTVADLYAAAEALVALETRHSPEHAFLKK